VQYDSQENTNKMKTTTKIMVVLSFMVLFSGCARINCEGSVDGSDDLYYYKHYTSNVSYGGQARAFECRTGSKLQDNIKTQQRQDSAKAASEALQQRRDCYEAGQYHNHTFDLMNDYDFSCDQIEYMNDHFILELEQKNAGSIKGSSSSFFGYGKLEGQFFQWINAEHLAVGQLPKQISYHLNCDNTTTFWRVQKLCTNGKIFPDEVSSCTLAKEGLLDTTRVQYYTKSDFIMYYTNKCI
jgi:hypothetical protein